jgi:hypothetical protein
LAPESKLTPKFRSENSYVSPAAAYIAARRRAVVDSAAGEKGEGREEG